MHQLYPEIRTVNEELKPILKELEKISVKRGKVVECRRQLGGQKNENELVKEELKNLEPDAVVFKLIGPALVPQDQNDAKTIVENRLDYINGEISKADLTIAGLEKNESQLQKNIQEFYRKIQEKQTQLIQHKAQMQ